MEASGLAESLDQLDGQLDRRVRFLNVQTSDLISWTTTDFRGFARTICRYFTLGKKNPSTIDAKEQFEGTIQGKADENKSKEILFWKNHYKNGITDDEIVESANKFKNIYEDFDKTLKNQKYLKGDKFTVVDLAWYVSTKRLAMAGIPIGKYKNVQKWFSNLDNDANFKKEIKIDNSIENKETNISSKMINQIKNVSQEEKSKPEVQTEIKANKNFIIKSFNDLIEICSNKKEIKLKYELEKNVNLVKFEKNRIEISFNESLNKDFVKELSSKLFEWTNERWIITFSQLKGERSIKDQQKNIKDKLIENSKKSEIYKDVIKNFPDAELINVKSKMSRNNIS